MAEKKQSKKPVKKAHLKKKATDKPTKDEVNVGVQASSVANTLLENNISGATKNFMIRCGKCCWSRISSGISVDLLDLNEIKANCNSCGKNRKFRCPKCGLPVFMKRIKGNI